LEQEELDAFLEENLCTGQIQPSKSPIAAPMFFIKKKDSSLWLVQDYRALNAVDGDQREFDLETRVTTSGNRIISEMFHSCALNK